MNLLNVKNTKKCFLKGFTLIELLVVVLIIGILAAIALPQYQKTVERARASEALTNLRALVSAEKVYQMTNGTATTDLSLLDIQLSGEIDADGKMVLPHFTYFIGNINNATKEGFEAVANRNNSGEELTDYYIYYTYTGNYACVSKKEAAKPICAGICGRMPAVAENGYFYCRIQ